jgi:tetratricopeptide (TPR) repeat protein
VKRVLLFAAAVFACAAAIAQAPHAGHPPAPAEKPPELFSGLGAHRHPIQTSSPEAQKYFDQGVTLLFGFNHEEAFRSFAKAAELDPKSPMPHWGMALALGANYNDTEPEADRLKRARAEVEKALALSAGAPGNERAYVEALSVRYVVDPSTADRAKLARDYAAAMRALSARYPDDLDAATMYAESLMNLHPWKLWKPDGTPGEDTVEIVAVLESVLKRDPEHPGANHYYIHAVEASKEPQKALPSAARLETLVPSAGHLVHMPAHIYMRTGSYAAAEKANAVAAEVDREYIRQTGAQGMYPMMYYTHNVHFESVAACMAGRHATAKRAGDVLFADVLPVANMPMMEGFLLQPTFVALRFRQWDEIRQMPDPGPKLPLLRAAWLYARAMAAAAAGEVQKAETLREAFVMARNALPADMLAGPQNTAAALLAVASHVLDARILEAKGDRRAAIASWVKAVAAEDALAYDEPPAWYYPVRESLGAALLLDGQPGEAEIVFRADLEINPRNGRSLYGLAEALEAQKKTADAAWTRARFEAAWKDADTKVRLEEM